VYAMNETVARDPTTLWHEPIVVTRPEQVRVGAHSRVDAFTKLEGGHGLTIGAYVHVASFCHLNIGGGTLVVENGANISSSCCIITGGNHHEAVSISIVSPPEDQVLTYGRVVIHEHAGLFVGVTIVGKGERTLHIGRGARVGAGSLVLHDIPENELWAGRPAQRLGYYWTASDGKVWLERSRRDVWGNR
jgi:acetyltransferase-like isoleucine patch superfamily enzyme